MLVANPLADPVSSLKVSFAIVKIPPPPRFTLCSQDNEEASFVKPRLHVLMRAVWPSPKG